MFCKIYFQLRRNRLLTFICSADGFNGFAEFTPTQNISASMITILHIGKHPEQGQQKNRAYANQKTTIRRFQWER